LAILAMILSIAVPRYFSNIETAKENVLREDLFVMRDAIDHFYSDRGTYPTQLLDLVTYNYLRSVPVDPITQSAASWILIAPQQNGIGAIWNVESGAPGQAQDGEWFINF
jgi:general secretion pathway protein G